MILPAEIYESPGITCRGFHLSVLHPTEHPHTLSWER